MNVLLKFKKLYFLFCLSILFFSSNYALNFIVDFASLVTNCFEERITFPSYFYSGNGAEFLRSRQNFMRPNRLSINPADFLTDICSQLSTTFWGNTGDVIKKFYKGEVKEKDVLGFILEADDVINLKIQQQNISQEKKEALRLVKNIFWGQYHQDKIPRNKRESVISFLECFKQTGCLQILKWIKDSDKKHTFYLIGDVPKEWFKLYKQKFENIFSFFFKENIIFSFQVGLTVDELDFYLNFFNSKDLDSENCWLITSNTNLNLLENYQFFKILFFDPRDPQALIVALKNMGVLNNEQRYFVPGV